MFWSIYLYQFSKPSPNYSKKTLGAFFIIWDSRWIHSYLHLKKEKKAEKEIEKIEEKIDPFSEALEQINQLTTASPRLAPKPFIFKLSEILRLYVERQFKLSAMEKTGEEFLVAISSHPLLKQKFESTLSDFISKSDLIKYSPKEFADKELELLLESAKYFINKAQIEFNAQKIPQADRVLERKSDQSAK